MSKPKFCKIVIWGVYTGTKQNAKILIPRNIIKKDIQKIQTEAWFSH